MKTSKPEIKQDYFRRKINNSWEATKVRLDRNPRKTAIWMAIILILFFLWFVYRTVYQVTHPIDKVENNLNQQIQNQFNPLDSITGQRGITSDLYDYFLLKEIQKEIEAMQRDSSKIDTTRLNQIIEMLK
jgi:hypothetical protein